MPRDYADLESAVRGSTAAFGRSRARKRVRGIVSSLEMATDAQTNSAELEATTEMRDLDGAHTFTAVDGEVGSWASHVDATHAGVPTLWS